MFNELSLVSRRTVFFGVSMCRVGFSWVKNQWSKRRMFIFCSYFKGVGVQSTKDEVLPGKIEISYYTLSIEE